MEEFTTDGASLPRFLRKFIVRVYDQDTMDLIDRCGMVHDYLMWKYPNSHKHNRKRFIRHLKRVDVPRELVIVIHAGLTVYDISPEWFKNLAKRTT